MANQEADTWQTRIEWIVNTYGRGESEPDRKANVSSRIEVSGEAMRLYWTGANKPGLDVLSRIAEAYPSINPEWLVTGRGPRERPDPDAAVETIGEIEAALLRLKEKQRAEAEAARQAAERLAAGTKKAPRKKREGRD